MSSDNESASPGTDLLTWEESTKLPTSEVFCPKVGGLMKQGDGTLIAHSGTNPDKDVNVWSYNVKTKTYVIEQDDRNPLWSDQQGSSHVYY